MTISLDELNEAEKQIAFTNASQRKRRKIERPDKQNVSEAVGGFSKEERRLAKKTRRAAEKKDDEAEVTEKLRYVFSVSN